MAAAVGLLAGLGNVLFRRLIDLFHLLIFEKGSELLGIGSAFPALLLLPLLPAAGAVLLIPLDLLFPGEVRGYGLPRFLERVNLRGALFRARTLAVKIIAPAVTIGTGGSAGVEGPIAQIGGIVGSMVGQIFHVGHERLKTLVACGVAAGIAGTFNAPLAGVFFAHEIVLLGSFEGSSFTPVVIASGVGTITTWLLDGNRRAFQIPPSTLVSSWEAVTFILLGLAMAYLAVHFIRSFYAISDRFRSSPLPTWLKAILGAAATGAVAIAIPQVLGNGYEHVEKALAGEGPGPLLLLIAFAKIYSTGLTLGSGNAGGVFAPSLFIGAMAGGAFGSVVTALFPESSSGAGVYALAGMGGFLAAATHAPMTAIFLIFEMTGEYSLILPIMFTCGIGYAVSRHLQKDSIDTLDLARRGIRLEEGRDVAVLQSLRVKDVMTEDVEALPEHTPLRQLLQRIPSSRHTTFPVVDTQGRLSGILGLQDFREVTYEEDLWDLVVAKELATPQVITAFSDETLRDVLDKIGFRNIEHVPVVSREDPKRIVGMVSRRDILSGYRKALLGKPGGAPS